MPCAKSPRTMPSCSSSSVGLSDSDVEEDGFAVALQADVEAVERRAVVSTGVEPLGDERLASLFPLDQVEDRILRVRRCLVAEVDARVQPHVDSCLLYTSPSPRDGLLSRMPSSA